MLADTPPDSLAIVNEEALRSHILGLNQEVGMPSFYVILKEMEKDFDFVLDAKLKTFAVDESCLQFWMVH